MMLKKLMAFFIVFLLSYNAMAQPKYKKATEAAEALRLAMISGDGNTLSALVDDGLTYGHSSGHVDNKQEFVEKLRSGKSDFVSIDITGQKVQLFKHTVTIRHLLNAVTNDNGVPGTVKLHVLQVWQKRGHTWKLIARQAVKVS